jgi:hypothetical protein
VTGWLEPTPNQLADARRLLDGRDNPAEVALRQISIHLDRVARGQFDAEDLRRLLAYVRAWEEL